MAPINPLQVGQHLQPKIVKQQAIADKAKRMLQLFEQGALERGTSFTYNSLRERFFLWYSQTEIDQIETTIKKLLSDIAANPANLGGKLLELIEQTKKFDRTSLPFARIEEFAFQNLTDLHGTPRPLSPHYRSIKAMVSYWAKLGTLVSPLEHSEGLVGNSQTAFKAYGDWLCSEFEVDRTLI